MSKGLTRTQLAESLGKSVQTISNWLNDGLPRRPDKKYDLPAVIDWLITRDRDVMGLPTGDATSPALELYREERAKIAKIERLRLEGSLISIDDVGEQWRLRVIEVASGLDAFADRLPPLLEDKPREAMRQIIDDEVYRLRDMYYRTGRFCEPPPGLIKLIDDFFKERKTFDA